MALSPDEKQVISIVIYGATRASTSVTVPEPYPDPSSPLVTKWRKLKRMLDEQRAAAAEEHS